MYNVLKQKQISSNFTVQLCMENIWYYIAA